MAMLFFIIVGAVSLASAVGVITSRQPIHSALFLLLHFVGLATLYITLDAQFLAAVQVIVYAGGIVILMLFVIMLIGSERINEGENRSIAFFSGITLSIALFGALAYALLESFVGVEPNAAAIQGGVPKAVGVELFTNYVLPFELVAILLLVALIGALLLARGFTTTNTDAS